MTTLVTGAAGFIGSQLSKHLLARGDSVIGIDNLNDYYSVDLKKARLAEIESSANFSFLKLDFTDFEALTSALKGKSIRRVVHLGAQAGVRYSLTNPFIYAQTNIMGHLNFLEFCRHEKSVDHMVYASSSSVYGGNKKQPFSVEDRVDTPISLYAASKKTDELMSQSYSHLYRMPLTGLRFFTVYGPWGRPDMALWLFTEAILAGKPIHVFNRGDMRRDFTYIDDIIQGLVAALDSPPADDGSVNIFGSDAPHRVYNIGNNQTESLMHMIEIIEDTLGLKSEKILEPMQPGDVKETSADISAIQADLGFQPTTRIESGIPNFIAWYKDYHGIA